MGKSDCVFQVDETMRKEIFWEMREKLLLLSIRQTETEPDSLVLV